MGQRVVYEQRVEIIEDYELEYSREDFIMDCNNFDITDITYEELSDILVDKIPDKKILVNPPKMDVEGVYIVVPQLYDAKEFFTLLMCDLCFQFGCFDRQELNILNRKFSIRG